MSKAYAQPLKKQAWRLFSNAATGYDIQSEIIPIYGSTSAEITLPTYHKKVEGTAWVDYTLQSGDTVKGTVSDLSDVVRLAQFVAQWDVEISQTPYVPQ